MAEIIRMPRMSDTMTEAVIVGWNKKVGDKVKPGDVLAEVETDKATMELESYNEGTLLYIGVDKGKSVKVDGVLAIVGKEGEDYSSVLKSATENGAEEKEKKGGEGEKKEEVKKEQFTDNKIQDNKVQNKKEVPEISVATLPEGAKEIRMPLLSDTMTEGKIISWNKKVGDAVKSDDVLAEVETDKATMEVVGYEDGTLLYIGVQAGNAAKINELIAIVGKEGTNVSAFVESEKQNKGGELVQPLSAKEIASPAKEENTQNEEVVREEVKTQQEGIDENADVRLKASPLAKKMASDKGIDIFKVNGTGDGGRITKKDITDYTPAKIDSKETIPALQNTVNGKEGHTDTPLTQMRKVIARRLSESKFSAPHFYLTSEINMDNAISARNSMNEFSPVKISFNDFIIKACASALRLHPAVNSSWMGDFIRHNHHIHIGSALALPEGLIVPVIKFADQMSLSAIAIKARELYTMAREKKLQPADFSGNTFTVSNLGMMDIEEFTAIINPPDSCILAIGNIREKVIKKNGVFDVTNVMKVTLSCDHRSVDGAVGAAFLQTLKSFIQTPVTMLV